MAKRLRDLQFHTEFLELEGESYPLHHINLGQVATLLDRYNPQIMMLMNASERGMPFELSTAMTIAPNLVSDIIALSMKTDEPEDIEAIKSFPPGVQLTALIKIWQISVPDPKALATIIESVRGRRVVANQDLSLKENLEQKSN